MSELVVSFVSDVSCIVASMSDSFLLLYSDFLDNVTFILSDCDKELPNV